MTADVVQACADLAAWLHPTRELITQPDTQPCEGRTQPGSAFPGNTSAFYLVTDIWALAREIEQDFTYRVAGTTRHRGGSEANTVKALQAIARLAEAVDQDTAGLAARQLNGKVTECLQQPAVDLEERARIVPAACPRCDRAKLLIYERSGRVGCPACRRRGWMVPGTVSAGMVQWEDGEIT